jgi:hypothetical protein
MSGRPGPRRRRLVVPFGKVLAKLKDAMQSRHSPAPGVGKPRGGEVRDRP